MKNLLLKLTLALASLSCASVSRAVEYVKLCPEPVGGPGFYYIPGTDRCFNPVTGEARQSVAISDTKTVIRRSLFPYPEGKWVTEPRQACGDSRLVKVGDFKRTDFKLDSLLMLQSPPFALQLKAGEFITKVIMSGGFQDPRLSNRSAINNPGNGLCLRSVDPGVFETQASGPPVNPPYGNGGLPIGCISNTRIVNMPAAYAISATAAYPSIDAYFVNGDSKLPVAGPYSYGKQLVVTTDVGVNSMAIGPGMLTYCDASVGTCGGGGYDSLTQTFTPLDPGVKNMAGTLSVWVCVADPQDGNAQ